MNIPTAPFSIAVFTNSFVTFVIVFNPSLSAFGSSFIVCKTKSRDLVNLLATINGLNTVSTKGVPSVIPLLINSNAFNCSPYMPSVTSNSSRVFQSSIVFTL